MNDASQLRAALAHCTGSSQWFRHPFSRCTYTEGVQAFAQNAGGGAYWLLDILLTEPAILRAVQAHGIVFPTLHVVDGKATITVIRDTGEAPLFERRLTYTDCPDGEWRFYFAGDVLMLPSEY